MTDDVNKILAVRPSTHGDFSDNSAISRVLKDTMSCYAGWRRLTNVQREALDMIAHKISRILAGDPNFKDHWDDIAGYATLVANRCEQTPLQTFRGQEAFAPNAACDFTIKTGDKLYCIKCDNNMRVNAAGYCLCEELGCPNAGKKVM